MFCFSFRSGHKFCHRFLNRTYSTRHLRVNCSADSVVTVFTGLATLVKNGSDLFYVYYTLTMYTLTIATVTTYACSFTLLGYRNMTATCLDIDGKLQYCTAVYHLVHDEYKYKLI